MMKTDQLQLGVMDRQHDENRQPRRNGELHGRLVRGLEAAQQAQLGEFRARFGEGDAWGEMSRMLTAQHARATGELEEQLS